MVSAFAVVGVGMGGVYAPTNTLAMSAVTTPCQSRDWNAAFTPKIVGKRKRRLSAIDELVISWQRNASQPGTRTWRRDGPDRPLGGYILGGGRRRGPPNVGPPYQPPGWRAG